MTDQDRIDRFLSGLARLSEETGIGLTFGRPGNESSLVLTGNDGSERFEVVRLELVPAGGPEEALSYELEFTGTIRISARAAEPSEKQEKQEAGGTPEPITRLPGPQPSGSLVRVDHRFRQRTSPLAETISAKPQRASGE